MKKLYGVLALVIILSMSLVGCQSPTDSTSLTEKEVLEAVEKYCKTDIISQELVCDTSEITDVRVFTALQAYEDTTEYPSYMLDDEGNYVTMEALGLLLKDKYFGIGKMEYDEFYKSEGVTMFQFSNSEAYDYNPNELYAKLVLILQEISSYNYYILNNEVVVKIVWNTTDGYTKIFELKTSSENLLSDTLTISPDSFFTGYLEMKYKDNGSVIVVEENITALYDSYVENGTYDGYVLNME